MKEKIFILLSVALLFSSCEDTLLNKCFSGEAKVVRKEIFLDSAVTRLYVMNEAEVYLRYSDEQQIEIEFPENLMEDVEFAYEKGNLRITNHVTCKWRKDNYAPKLYLSLPHVRRFDIIDFVKVFCLDTLRYDQISFYSLGTGDFHLLTDVKNMRIQSDYVADFYVNGKVENLTLWYKNVGRFYGKNLKSQNIKVDHHGENDLYINPLKSLKATLFNYGNIYSYQNPATLEVDQRASGKLIIVED